MTSPPPSQLVSQHNGCILCNSSHNILITIPDQGLMTCENAYIGSVWEYHNVISTLIVFDLGWWCRVRTQYCEERQVWIHFHSAQRILCAIQMQPLIEVHKNICCRNWFSLSLSTLELYSRHEMLWTCALLIAKYQGAEWVSECPSCCCFAFLQRPLWVTTDFQWS